MTAPQSLPQTLLPWADPLAFTASVLADPATAAGDWVLLHSGVRTAYSGRFSYLACLPAESIRGDDFSALASSLSADRGMFDNAWFGYLGYGLKNTLEQLPQDKPGWCHLPNLTLTRFSAIFCFDHDNRTLTLHGQYPTPVYERTYTVPTLPQVDSITSNMDKQSYLDKVAAIVAKIHEGELYQANLTRKFIGAFREPPEPFAVFCALNAASPAAYSALIKRGDTYIISSSPEQFISIDAQGHMQTRPIKGTAPRFADPDLDRKSYEKLATSEKDRAENLMIVDLMRNDFSRCCTPGSVATQSLFDITSHATIHHLSSTVTGDKRPDCTTLGALAACFPPGSMTGAPKIRAMQVCSEAEAVERGVYSGAIGWFGGDGSCDLSVVIRTLILRGRNFEFQVGGGIVADSIPEAEWMETIDKTKGICLALRIKPKALQL